MSTHQIKNRKKKKLGSYPYVSVVFSIALALFVIGLFALLILHSNRLATWIRENVEIQVYLDKDITDNQRIQIQKTLSAKPYAALSDGEVQIRFTSREEAAQSFIEETGEDFSDFLGQNPLRDAYSLRINPEYHVTDSMQQIRTEIEAMSGVFEVDYVENLVEEINRNVTYISLAMLGIALLLLIAVVLLINNTIKLALFSQRFLIRSMQLVGARPGFIQRPFLWRSILHGLIAGLIASLLLYLVIQFANREIDGLSQLQDPNLIGAIFLALLFLGAGIAVLSSYRAIKKYLRMSLDELY
ncbi:cell division protein FtsX [Fulvivirga sedimenti]|uniref:Cell division protein FtsX n=1 Tax=Fulvivirga sedimenti TaxID=2879465 RepID=A0A9X1HJI1_9BACT|nr:permease-like cell division protein FtsX [Fulvivirga sedimenti]